MTTAIAHIIKNCFSQNKVNLLIIYDESALHFVNKFKIEARKLGKEVELLKINCGNRHGEEPPDSVVCKMLTCDAVMCLTQYSLAHTSARKEAEKKGIPFLSMPDYNDEMLNKKALLADYRQIFQTVEKYTCILSKGSNVTVTTDKGTELYLNINGRKGNCCPGLTEEGILLGSPPDIEANISPIETFTYGKIVVDGSITDKRIGLLTVPVVLVVENGSVIEMKCSDINIEKTVKQIFADIGSPNAYVVGEMGIGFNDKAELCGNMLIDEGAKGCVHFGIGSNWTIGGANKVDFHLDFVVKDATVEVDGEKIMEKGVLSYE